MSDIGVMVCGHGSRDEQAVAEFASVARGIRERLPHYPVESGFLEFATPIIRDGLDKLRTAGCRRVLAVPGMLFAAGHAKNDIPAVLNTYQAQHPEMSIDYGRELAIDAKLINAAADRVREALAEAGDGVPAHETLLMVVGRGASDPDANSNVAKVMRLLWEGFGFGWGETSYSGVTFPLVQPGLEHAAKLGYRRIIVFPYFLFTGVLVKRIYDHTDLVAARHPEIEFVKAPYLSDHPLVLDSFAERVEEILTGGNLMNCKLCKYREQILGFAWAPPRRATTTTWRASAPAARARCSDWRTQRSPIMATTMGTATVMATGTATVTTTISTGLIPTPTIRTGRAAGPRRTWPTCRRNSRPSRCAWSMLAACPISWAIWPGIRASSKRAARRSAPARRCWPTAAWSPTA
jgi:sirohydrochlorin cobaltochelatase